MWLLLLVFNGLHRISSAFLSFWKHVVAYLGNTGQAMAFKWRNFPEILVYKTEIR